MSTTPLEQLTKFKILPWYNLISSPSPISLMFYLNQDPNHVSTLHLLCRLFVLVCSNLKLTCSFLPFIFSFHAIDLLQKPGQLFCRKAQFLSLCVALWGHLIYVSTLLQKEVSLSRGLIQGKATIFFEGWSKILHRECYMLPIVSLNVWLCHF